MGMETTPMNAKAKEKQRLKQIKKRLEHLRGELRAERISYGELAELQDLATYIEPGDVELLEPAGVPESLEERQFDPFKKWMVESNLKTIAEGVPMETQVAILRGNGYASIADAVEKALKK